MIKLIVGNKGAGKTKTLVDLINKSAKQTDGNLVCVEKGQKLMYEIDHSVRLINTDDYSLSGYDAFYGFITGLLAANYDLKEIFVDSILKIGGGNLDSLAAFIEKVQSISEEITLIFTVSADESVLPESIKKYIM